MVDPFDQVVSAVPACPLQRDLVPVLTTCLWASEWALAFHPMAPIHTTLHVNAKESAITISHVRGSEKETFPRSASQSAINSSGSANERGNANIAIGLQVQIVPPGKGLSEWKGRESTALKETETGSGRGSEW